MRCPAPEALCGLLLLALCPGASAWNYWQTRRYSPEEQELSQRTREAPQPWRRGKPWHGLQRRGRENTCLIVWTEEYRIEHYQTTIRTYTNDPYPQSTWPTAITQTVVEKVTITSTSTVPGTGGTPKNTKAPKTETSSDPSPSSSNPPSSSSDPSSTSTERSSWISGSNESAPSTDTVKVQPREPVPTPLFTSPTTPSSTPSTITGNESSTESTDSVPSGMTVITQSHIEEYGTIWTSDIYSNIREPTASDCRCLAFATNGACTTKTTTITTTSDTTITRTVLYTPKPTLATTTTELAVTVPIVVITVKETETDLIINTEDYHQRPVTPTPIVPPDSTPVNPPVKVTDTPVVINPPASVDQPKPSIHTPGNIVVVSVTPSPGGMRPVHPPQQTTTPGFVPPIVIPLPDQHTTVTVPQQPGKPWQPESINPPVVTFPGGEKVTLGPDPIVTNINSQPVTLPGQHGQPVTIPLQGTTIVVNPQPTVQPGQVITLPSGGSITIPPAQTTEQRVTFGTQVVTIPPVHQETPGVGKPLVIPLPGTTITLPNQNLPDTPRTITMPDGQKVTLPAPTDVPQVVTINGVPILVPPKQTDDPTKTNGGAQVTLAGTTLTFPPGATDPITVTTGGKTFTIPPPGTTPIVTTIDGKPVTIPTASPVTVTDDREIQITHTPIPTLFYAPGTYTVDSQTLTILQPGFTTLSGWTQTLKPSTFTLPNGQTTIVPATLTEPVTIDLGSTTLTIAPVHAPTNTDGGDVDKTTLTYGMSTEITLPWTTMTLDFKTTVTLEKGKTGSLTTTTQTESTDGPTPASTSTKNAAAAQTMPALLLGIMGAVFML